MERTEDNLARGELGLLSGGVCLISLSALLFEIALVRMFSVMLTAPYVFMVISLALFGLGLGGIFVHLFRGGVLGVEDRFRTLARFAFFSALSVGFVVSLLTRLPYTGRVLLYGGWVLIPFFFTGVVLSSAFRMFPGESSRIYGADLIGAAGGCILALWLLGWLGGVRTGLFVGWIGSGGALLFAIGGHRAKTYLLGGFVIGGWFLLHGAGLIRWDVPVADNPAKDMYELMHQASWPAEIVETRWSPFGRTDLVQYSTFPDWMVILIDGGAGTNMYRFNGDLEHPDPEVAKLKEQFAGYFPYFFLKPEEKRRVLIIGPGGGKDVLCALMGGAKQILGVEVNRDLVDMVRDYSAYNGGIYTNYENVEVIVAEGRSFLRRSRQRYDVIMLALPVIKSVQSYEAHALAENHIFTTEAIGEYLDHLTPGGRMVVVTHHTVALLRVLSVSLAALKERGIETPSAMERIYTVGAPDFPALVLRNGVFGPGECLERYTLMKQLGYDKDPAYLPHVNIERPGAISARLQALARGEMSWREMEEAVRFDIRPVTDDRPFFYHFRRGLPSTLVQLFWGTMVLILGVVVVPWILYRVMIGRRRGTGDGGQDSDDILLPPVIAGSDLFRWVLLFLMLGAGFMLIEIGLIQKFVLFLGHPVLSLAVLLFAILLGASIGALYSRRPGSKGLERKLGRWSLCIVATVVLYVVVLPRLFEGFLGASLGLRLALSCGLLIPLGFLMGFPFPCGMRMLDRGSATRVIPWMWGINGSASVLGAVSATVLGMKWGFTAELLFGAGAYAVVGILFAGTSHPPGEDTGVSIQETGSE